MSLTTLKQALPIVAAAYGQKFGVPVMVGGDRAYTDGKQIRIPAVDETETNKLLAFGYLAHESGHVRFTDFQAARSSMVLTKWLENAVEDVRIEQEMIRIYPGTRLTMDKVISHLLANRQLVSPNLTDPPEQVLCNAILVIARYRHREQVMLEQEATKAEQVLRSVFGTDCVEGVLKLLSDIPSLGSTEDSIALAARLSQWLRQVQSQQKLQTQVDESTQVQQPVQTERATTPEPSSSGESGDENQNPSASETSSTSKASQDQSADDQPTAQQGANSAPSQDRTVSDDPGSQPTPTAIQSALSAVLAAPEENLPTDLFESVGETLNANCGPLTTLMPIADSFLGHINNEEGAIALKRVKAHSAKLTARLQGLVQSENLSRVVVQRHGRQLSAKHLHRAALGDSRLFVQKVQHQAINTAVHCLVDLSGSMNNSGKYRIALDSAMALALALEMIKGVEVGVTAFPGQRGRRDRVTPLLRPGERVRSCAARFAAQSARGGTPLTEGFFYAAAELLKGSESRRVLIVLTDGIPNDSDSAVTLMRRATLSGIEIIGIGIAVDISHLFPVSILIDSIADLKQQLFRIAEKLLLNNQR